MDANAKSSLATLKCLIDTADDRNHLTTVIASAEARRDSIRSVVLKEALQYVRKRVRIIQQELDLVHIRLTELKNLLGKDPYTELTAVEMLPVAYPPLFESTVNVRHDNQLKGALTALVESLVAKERARGKARAVLKAWLQEGRERFLFAALGD